MEPTLNHIKFIEEYFRIWKTYDLLGIIQLFDDNARYEINSIQKILNGIDEICEYWKRNAQRQEELELFWDILSMEKSYVKVYFIANFYDNEEKEYQKIKGNIKFHLNDHNNKIILLSEFYRKISLGENKWDKN